jgi:hypothetical protein
VNLVADIFIVIIMVALIYYGGNFGPNFFRGIFDKGSSE